MPRNGSNIYFIPPGTEGFPDTTIESEKYNNYIHDVETDLNRPRPISAGGTGADDADEALANLGAEKSSQAVTNYDTHVFYPGSFYSVVGATNAPIAGHKFVGIAVSSDPPASPPANLNVVIRAYDQSNTVVPGRIYVREKKAGVWSAWSQDSTGIAGPTPPLDPPDGLLWFDSEGGHLYVWYNDGNSKQWVIASPFADPAQFLLKAGDTMEGNLGLAAHPVNPLDAASKQYVDDTIQTEATAIANNKVDKAGDTMTGTLTVNAGINGTSIRASTDVWSSFSATTGYYHFGTSGTKYIAYDGANYTVNGGGMYVNNGSVVVPSGDIHTFRSGEPGGGIVFLGNFGNRYLQYYSGDNQYHMPNSNLVLDQGALIAGGSVISNSQVIARNPTAFAAEGVVWTGAAYLTSALVANPAWASVQLQAVHFPGNWAGWRFAGANGVSLDVHMSDQDGYVYSGNWWKPGGGFWADSSDARIKNVKHQYRSGLDMIAALNPVVYTFKGNDTTDPPTTDPASLKSKDERGELPVASVPYPNSQHYLDATRGTQFIGLVAQECEDIMPELVTKKKGIIDGVEVDDVRGLNSTPIVFALINACKELKARVEALEAKGG